eukprot:389537-Prymnesium_polylepis.1
MQCSSGFNWIWASPWRSIWQTVSKSACTVIGCHSPGVSSSVHIEPPTVTWPVCHLKRGLIIRTNGTDLG